MADQMVSFLYLKIDIIYVEEWKCCTSSVLIDGEYPLMRSLKLKETG